MTSVVSSDRVQRLVIGAAAAANKARIILMGTAMAVYVEQAGGTPFAVGMVFTVYWFGLMGFSPVFGAIADVTGRRRTVLISTAALATLAILPLTVVHNVWGPIFFRGVFAIFAAGFLPVMLTIVSERGGVTDRGESLGFFNSTQAVGFTLAQLLAGMLLGLVAPWTLYLFVAIVSAIVVLAGIAIHDPTPAAETEPSVRAITAEVKDRLLPTKSDRGYLRSHGLRWLYIAVLFRNITVLGIGSLLPVYLLNNVGVAEVIMGILLAINPAGQMAFMYLFGRVADITGRKPLVVGGMAGAGLHALLIAGAVFPPTITQRVIVAAIALFVLAAAYSAETTGTYAFIGDVAPARRESELMGLHSTARGFGGMVGPVLLGGVATVTSYELAFAGASLLALSAALLVAILLIESFPHHTPSPVTGED